MAKFMFTELVDISDVFTARLGAGTGAANNIDDKEVGKFVKLAGESRYDLCAAGNEIALATTDVFNADLVDALRSHLDTMPLPPPAVEFDGDKLAADAPLRVLLVSAEQYAAFTQTTGYRTYLANAIARGQQAEERHENHLQVLGEDPVQQLVQLGQHGDHVAVLLHVFGYARAHEAPALYIAHAGYQREEITQTDSPPLPRPRGWGRAPRAWSSSAWRSISGN